MQRALEEIRTAIHDDVGEILRHFESATFQEPWIHLPADFRLDHLGELAMRIADLALGEDDEDETDRCRKLVQAAAAHGEQRLRDGFQESLLFHEHYLMLNSLWDFLQSRLPPEIAFTAIIRIDAAITHAARASIRGFHRVAYEDQGEWPECIEALVGRWQTLRHTEKG